MQLSVIAFKWEKLFRGYLNTLTFEQRYAESQMLYLGNTGSFHTHLSNSHICYIRIQQKHYNYQLI